MARRRHRRRRGRPLGRKKRGTCPAFEVVVEDPYSSVVHFEAVGDEEYGHLDVGRAGDYATVHSVRVRSDVRRCGVGTRMYEAALEWACQRGLKLRSDTLRTKYSEGFWRKQHKKGRALCVEDPVETGRVLLDDDAPGGTWDCDFYEMKEACPTDRSLRGKRRGVRRRKRRRRQRRR